MRSTPVQLVKTATKIGPIRSRPWWPCAQALGSSHPYFFFKRAVNMGYICRVHRSRECRLMILVHLYTRRLRSPPSRRFIHIVVYSCARRQTFDQKKREKHQWQPMQVPSFQIDAWRRRTSFPVLGSPSTWTSCDILPMRCVPRPLALVALHELDQLDEDRAGYAKT